MSEEELKPHLNPHSFLTEPVDIFDAVAVPVPPGTKAPPRPPGKERTASELPVTEPFEIFTEQAIPMLPGTKAPPRPPGKERRRPVAQPPADVAALVARIESALQTIQAALAEIKQIQSRAG
jgi:hypothetical protein